MSTDLCGSASNPIVRDGDVFSTLSSDAECYGFYLGILKSLIQSEVAGYRVYNPEIKDVMLGLIYGVMRGLTMLHPQCDCYLS